jgi:hypothetical protein
MKLIMARHVAEQTAALLDQVIPGWVSLINRDTLNIASCERCIVGQLFPDEATFTDGMLRLYELFSDAGITGHGASITLGLNDGWHDSAKFADLDLGDMFDSTDQYWLDNDTLTLAWQQLIDDRELVGA